ncbi:hypothetical protein Ddye_020924 [Dipteronia dyeriana]|uniref:DUF1985 domain-containing protein n=1 Tax=Dipteronia dyeriana TaxID=168575 RepID=A0AAD9U0M6_9ROSI|nr:hypothetical protein Ddye_020924 [Dipteronia dyeriana]
MENMNLEDFSIKLGNLCLKKSTINLYSSLNWLPEIAKVLKQVKQLGALRETCFGHLLAIPKEVTFSTGVMHNLLLRQICKPGVTRKDEFHFLVGGKVAKFTKREFCLVIGLKFGEMSDIFLKTYHVISGGIHDRYFGGDENVQLKHVWEKFMGGQFEQPKDGLKMTLVLIANNVLFGQDLRRTVSLWLFALVEDLESFNSFPWGSYVYMMTIHYLRQGPQFVPFNYDDCEQRPNDDGNDVDDADDGNDADDKDSSRTIRELMNAMSKRFEDIVKKKIQKKVSAMEKGLKKRLDRVDKRLDDLVQPHHQVTSTY